MSAQVIPIQATKAEVEDAWDAYIAARRRLDALYERNSGTKERFDAEMEALRLHRQFARLAARWELS